ncbi:MAG: phosphogluconate dehydratase [Ostreibacterium sp.]
MINPILQKITEDLIKRSCPTREKYLTQVYSAKKTKRPTRNQLSCTNFAHAIAAMPNDFKIAVTNEEQPNIAIVSAYNDMLSAHQPFKAFPDIIKKAVKASGATAQFAGGTPAMCDGITQGYDGMELSLFSRDVIAMSTAIALSHHMFDGIICLGVCDKIVPGLLIGSLSFGHLPTVFAPAGPMTSGITNDEKAKTRQLFAEGKVNRDVLLESETKSYHSPGTCTFYGTANSNQMLMEFMGLHLPNTAFCNPNTPLRNALTAEAGHHIVKMTQDNNTFKSVGEIIDEKAIINGVIGLLTTGGSTNHTLHLIAIARTAGIDLRWSDFDTLSDIIPLLARVYPNGKADVNHFQAAGGLGFLIRELLDAGLLHESVNTIVGKGLYAYTNEPYLIGEKLSWKPVPEKSLDEKIVRSVVKPFSKNGGLKLLTGNIGKAIIKISAVAEEHRIIEAPAVIFHHQNELIEAFNNAELEKDFIAVVRYQGPRANGMPELHKLTPQLVILQQRGFKVALITDGRMSGASGKIPAAIHCSPEALLDGNIGKIQANDMLRLNANTGELIALVDETIWHARKISHPDLSNNQTGMGRELFSGMRQLTSSAEQGAVSFPHPLWQDN